ncbi:class I SAM-dependent methyltransferase [Bacteriovoracales bacterium]|nr:class I SAM-dependent methyltransferase [Bacteriovoracales bacterium]
MKRNNCRISGEPLTLVADFGKLYLSDFYKEKNIDLPKEPLRLGLGKKSGLAQLMDTADRDILYRQYWYLSGTNLTMTRQLKNIVDTVPDWIKLKDGDYVLDIGANDGTLLNQYPNDIKLVKVGIDPAKNIAEKGREASDLHACDYFTQETYDGLAGKKKAKVITSIAMFYDLDDPSSFVKDIYNCLDDDGIWISQLSYTPLMLKQNAFDNIIHEHLEYYTLISVDKLLKEHDLKILNVELNDTNAGSVRLTVAKNNNPVKDAMIFNKDIGQFNYNSFYNYEKKLGVDTEEAWHGFHERIVKLKDKTIKLLNDLRAQGKKVYGYGASTKGNTLLQYYGIDSSLITAIAERQPQKYGTLAPGSWIPVISEKEMREAKPDYLFVLPWHFFNEFYKRESDFLKNGGKFIVPLPELQIFE